MQFYFYLTPRVLTYAQTGAVSRFVLVVRSWLAFIADSVELFVLSSLPQPGTANSRTHHYTIAAVAACVTQLSDVHTFLIKLGVSKIQAVTAALGKVDANSDALSYTLLLVDSVASSFLQLDQTLRAFWHTSWNTAYTSVQNAAWWLSNPNTDLDLSTNTDCEDMLAFFGDVVEFAEQDKVLLTDAAFDVWFNFNWGSALALVEVALLSQLNRKTLSIFLAKFCNA